jgi:translin
VRAGVQAVAEELRRRAEARERGLSACRSVIQLSGRSIRAVHRGEPALAAELADEAAARLAEAVGALVPHPSLAHGGFLHDAAKEYVEARATAALVAGAPVPSATELGVEGPAWLNGLAEAASELRRQCLDHLRGGDLDGAEALLTTMDDVFSELVAIDLHDSVTGGLRRTLDALRAVLERTRGDVTSAVVQHRLQEAIERRLS